MSAVAAPLHTDTFTDGSLKAAMTSIRVPETVMSLALTPKANDQMGPFMKALTRFQKEDPTFKVGTSGVEDVVSSGQGVPMLCACGARLPSVHMACGWPLKEGAHLLVVRLISVIYNCKKEIHH